MKLSIMFLAGTALVAVTGFAHAQTSGASRAMPSTGAAAPSSAGNAAPPVSAGTPSPSQSAPAAKPAPANLTRMDAYFAQQAASGGLTEIGDAKIALQQSSNDQVKQFAQMMIDDHSKANDQLKQIVAQKGLALPDTPSAEEEDSQPLQQLKGAAFDRRYAAKEVKDHEDTIQLFQDEQTKGSDGDLKQFASDTLPTLEKHLDKAKQLNAEVTGTASRHHKAKANSSGSSSAD